MPVSDRKKTPPAPLSRREFIKKTSVSMAGLAIGKTAASICLPSFSTVFAGHAATLDELTKNAPVARYWISTNMPGVNCTSCHKEAVSEKTFTHPETFIKCELCAQECIIPEGKRGKCRTRINDVGQLKSLVYGRPISVHVDPIEKKPFYHFLPGTSALSLATAGCPLKCQFCQNWEISQARPEDFKAKYTPPEIVVKAAVNNSTPIIAFTYNEPTVFTEYLTDIARDGRQNGIKNVLISCGFMNEKPLAEMCSVLDAIKIDLKGFSNNFYNTVCNAELEPVLRSIKQVAKSGIHLEIVNLVVPTLNDSKKMLTELAKWVVGEVGPDVPVHFTRFHPDYKMLNLPPTPVETLEQAYETAKANGMRYPFVGNVPGHPGNNTYCPACGKAVVKRTGFFVTGFYIADGKCTYCKEPIAGVWTKS